MSDGFEDKFFSMTIQTLFKHFDNFSSQQFYDKLMLEHVNNGTLGEYQAMALTKTFCCDSIS